MPAILNGKIQKFFFKEEDMVAAFDLNNLYARSKDQKKQVVEDTKKAKAVAEETKKTN